MRTKTVDLPEEIFPQIVSMKQKIYKLLNEVDHPMHEKEICKELGYHMGGAPNRNLRELLEKGFIKRELCHSCGITKVYSIAKSSQKKKKHS